MNLVRQDIRDSGDDGNFRTEQGLPVPLQVSIGVAERQPGNESPSELMSCADKVLYRAKAAGQIRPLRTK